jgi:fibronectin type 3 domain-containing protein
LIGKVTLNWTSNPDATGYEVWRSSTSGGSYAYLTTVTPVTFNDIAISGTTHYFYKVKVVVGTLLGSLSNEAEGWAKINYPVKVPSISATQGTLYGQSTVSWSAATDASTYNLFRSISLGTKGALVVSGLAGLSYDDNTVSSGTHYFYTVVSVNNTGNGPDSDQAEGWGKVPSILSNLAATQGTLSGKVRLTWTNDPDATGYEVYRSTTSSHSNVSCFEL